MENFRTVAAVLVVLLAFTGFQLIANRSLRKAVQRDMGSAEARLAGITAQMESAEARVAAVTSSLRELALAAEKLSRMLEAVNSQAAAAEAASGQLAKGLQELKAKAAALDAAVEAALKKLGSLEKAGESAQSIQFGLEGSGARLVSLEAGLAAASKTAALAAGEMQKLSAEMARQKQSIDAAALAEFVKELERVRVHLKQLAPAVQAAKPGIETP